MKGSKQLIFKIVSVCALLLLVVSSSQAQTCTSRDYLTIKKLQRSIDRITRYIERSVEKRASLVSKEDSIKFRFEDLRRNIRDKSREVIEIQSARCAGRIASGLLNSLFQHRVRRGCNPGELAAKIAKIKAKQDARIARANQREQNTLDKLKRSILRMQEKEQRYADKQLAQQQQLDALIAQCGNP